LYFLIRTGADTYRDIQREGREKKRDGDVITVVLYITLKNISSEMDLAGTLV
jgi:hypothetical protein